MPHYIWGLTIQTSYQCHKVVLLRIPVFKDRDFRILRPFLKKGFESDPDLYDPNPQIPQRRSVKKHSSKIPYTTLNFFQKSPKFGKLQAILGAFYLATNIRIPALKIRIFFLLQKRAKESDL
jgi:hypothetical protein